jgi:hypothetical protein
MVFVSRQATDVANIFYSSQQLNKHHDEPTWL